MKKTVLLAILALAGWSINAQISVPNGDFETWSSLSYEEPQNYRTSNNKAFLYYKTPANCLKVTDAYQGLSALKLITNGSDTNINVAYAVNGNPDNDPQSWHGGIKWTPSEKPTGFQGYYKSDIKTLDTAYILASFSKGGINIGTYYLALYGAHTSYIPFSLTFDPPLTEMPDSAIFGATSSNVFGNLKIPGSMLQIDNVSYTGVTSQPALLNGDFELWVSQTLYRASEWYINNGEKSGVDMTTDMHSGNYAIKLTTTTGDENGIPVARNATISTGYYVCPNNTNCYQKGGFPYDKQIDALGFWYKYAPVADDKAQFNITFKNNGNFINGSNIPLLASAEYKYMEIPINLGQMPDSVIVEFQSSIWEHRTVNYAGSVLIIDDVIFKSQRPTVGLSNQRPDEKISVFPNPGNGIFYIKSDLKNAKVEVINLFGEKVNTSAINTDNADIDISDQPKGIYFYQIKLNSEIIKKGKIIIK